VAAARYLELRDEAAAGAQVGPLAARRFARQVAGCREGAGESFAEFGVLLLERHCDAAGLLYLPFPVVECCVCRPVQRMSPRSFTNETRNMSLLTSRAR
jgi:hypothetical protein